MSKNKYNISYSINGNVRLKGTTIIAFSFANMEKKFKEKFPEGEIEGAVLIRE